MACRWCAGLQQSKMEVEPRSWCAVGCRIGSLCVGNVWNYRRNESVRSLEPGEKKRIKKNKRERKKKVLPHNAGQFAVTSKAAVRQ